MSFKFLIIDPVPSAWGKHDLNKSYFLNAVQRGDLIINLEDGTYFDKDSNSWQPIEGDK